MTGQELGAECGRNLLKVNAFKEYGLGILERDFPQLPRGKNHGHTFRRMTANVIDPVLGWFV